MASAPTPHLTRPVTKAAITSPHVSGETRTICPHHPGSEESVAVPLSRKPGLEDDFLLGLLHVWNCQTERCGSTRPKCVDHRLSVSDPTRAVHHLLDAQLPSEKSVP